METLEFLEDLTNGNYVAPLTKENLKLIAKTAKDQAVADVKQAKQFAKDQKTQEKEAKKNGVPKDSGHI